MSKQLASLAVAALLTAMFADALSAQYRILIWREAGGKILFAAPGPNVKVTDNSIDCLVPQATPPATYVFFPLGGQKVFIVTEPGTVRLVDVHRNGVLLTDQSATPDYTLSADKKTVTLADIHAAAAGDVMQVKVWH